MTSRGHLACGALGVFALSPLAAWVNAPFVVRATLAGVVMFGSLAPDLDMPQSYLGRRTFPLPYLVRFLISNPLTWTICGLSARPHSRVGWLWWPLTVLATGRERLRWLVRHRGFSHSFFNAILVGVALGAGLAAGLAVVQRELSWTLLADVTGIGTCWNAATWAALHGAALTLGCLVHLAGDACTITGVPLWLPASDRAVHLLPRSFRLRTR